MIRSVEGCIREEKSNVLVNTDFTLPLGPETTIENGCLKVIVVEEVICVFFHMLLKVITSAELQFTNATR